MEKRRCILCGAYEAQKNAEGEYFCSACKGRFNEQLSSKQISKVETALGRKLDEQEERRIGNAVFNLWKAVHEEYIGKVQVESIIGYCREVQRYIPDDIRAKFYKAVCEGNNAKVREILEGKDLLDEENRAYLPDIVEFGIRSLSIKSFLSLKTLIEKAYANSGQYTAYINLLEVEAAKLKDGVYELTGDVFLAYSSKDIEWVKEVCEYLENDENQLRCFFAYRNLRHVSLGTNSGENDYWKNLKTAIKNCTCVVFLSSKNSREITCDAIDELAYLRDNLQEKPRIEYIGERGEEYDLSDCARKVQLVLSGVFKTTNWCRTKESLADWVIEQKIRAVTRENNDAEAAGHGKEEALRKAQAAAEKILREAQEEAERIKREAQERAYAEANERARLAEQRAEEARRRKEEDARAERAREIEAQRRKEAEKKKEEERLKQEAAKRVEEEKRRTEAARRAAEEKKKQEVARKVEEAKKKAEEECKKQDEAKRNPTLENYPREDFEIDGTKLVRYSGKGGEVTIPRGVTLIGDGAFGFCSRLKSIKIPNSMTSIGDGAFCFCSRLKSIKIPNSMTSIGDGAFGLSGLRSIVFNGTKKEWIEIRKEEGWDKDTDAYTVQCIDGDLKK